MTYGPSGEDQHDLATFISRYNRWRSMFSRAGEPAPQEAVRDGDRIVLRQGYPYEGWTGYVIEPGSGGYRVLSVTTERRVEPLESLRGFFSTFELAGKYILWKIGGDLRVSCDVVSLEMLRRPALLAPGVRAVPLEQYETRYELIDDPAVFMVIRAGGIQPENCLLTMTYDELDQALEDGLPPSVIGGSDSADE